VAVEADGSLYISEADISGLSRADPSRVRKVTPDGASPQLRATRSEDLLEMAARPLLLKFRVVPSRWTHAAISISAMATIIECEK
jgi:hypothetical protein